jgi:hypothetical protein
MNADAAALRARNLRTLAALAGLFLLPLLIAFFTYYGTGWRPAGMVNHGSLITPARPLPAVSVPRVSLTAGAADAPAASAELLHAKWSLVYLGDGACAEACRATLYVARQTRLALNNDMTRVQRVFLATGDCCDRGFLAREQPGLVVLDASGSAAQALLHEFPPQAREHTLFIVDPLGNLMMSYDARKDPHGLLEDLKKLLRLSQVG